jgi:hypothetical protein
MSQPLPDRDLIQYMQQMVGLTSAESERLVDEILNYFDETWQAFVKRRHKELQKQGHNNVLIYARIQQEIRQRRFAAPALSERQIRRIIYG